MCVKLNFRARAGQDSTGAITRAVDPDPHGSAFIFPPESESRREKISNKNRKMQENW